MRTPILIAYSELLARVTYMNNKKMVRGIVSIVILIGLISSNTEASLLVNVGVSIGDVFEYKYTEVQLQLKHNGTTYVNYQGEDIVGKTINVTVDDFNETVGSGFIGFYYERVKFNQTERFDNIERETSTYLDHWLDLYLSVELSFNSSVVSFNPEYYSFHPPDPDAIYNYTTMIGLPIYASTNISFYEDLNENGLPENEYPYFSKTEPIKNSREEQISFLDNILKVNVTNEETFNGVTSTEENWSIHGLSRYDVTIDAKLGLVKAFMYSISYEVVVGLEHTEVVIKIAFEKIMGDSSTIDFSLSVPILMLTSIIAFSVLKRRTKKK